MKNDRIILFSAAGSRHIIKKCQTKDIQEEEACRSGLERGLKDHFPE